MNRLAVGLAVGAGYVLGRTKKAKFAFAVGTMVAGKRLHLSPKALGALVTRQLENNPQFKEIGDQLRDDLRGVGKAATGSLANRQLDGLADRLHDRTQGIQDRISGVVPDDVEDAAPKKPSAPRAASRKTEKAATKTAPKTAMKAAQKSAQQSARKPARKAPQRAPQKSARKPAQKKSTAAARTGGGTKGGGDHG
ncbi:DNA primase [Streptomyces sp. NPDC059002]|uniref:DNA primase n=1 Tax=Streptomyces sp. NPDC059002 TaxID=3346690 RepID=UPI00368F3AC5